MRVLVRMISGVIFTLNFLQYLFMGVTLERISIMALAMVLFILTIEER